MMKKIVPLQGYTRGRFVDLLSGVLFLLMFSSSSFLLRCKTKVHPSVCNVIQGMRYLQEMCSVHRQIGGRVQGCQSVCCGCGFADIIGSGLGRRGL